MATNDDDLTLSPEEAEAELNWRALRSMREARRMTQGAIARIVKVSTSNWQQKETGQRGLDDDDIDLALKAMNASRHDFEAERARLLGSSKTARSAAQGQVIHVYGRARAGPQGPEIYDVGEPIRTLDLRQMIGPNMDAMQVAGDSMVPWAEPGEVVLFDRDRYPRRRYGCVVEMKTGEAYVKLYEGSNGSQLFVREFAPEERTLTFQMKDVLGVYAVVLRGA